MIDTPHNRRKMIWYVLGMQRVLRHLNYDDDPGIFIDGQKQDIEAIKTDWGITDDQLDRIGRKDLSLSGSQDKEGDRG